MFPLVGGRRQLRFGIRLSQTHTFLSRISIELDNPCLKIRRIGRPGRDMHAQFKLRFKQKVDEYF